MSEKQNVNDSAETGNTVEAELDTNAHSSKPPKPYSNPYLAGIGLGLVLLAAFVIMGRGLGGSGAVNTLVSVTMDKIAHEHAQNNLFYSDYLGDGSTNPLKNWLLFQVIGVIAGGFLSGMLAHRVRKEVGKGPHISNKMRFVFATIGGALMAIGAKLASGCTSGQALTGGALLNLGSWAFMLSVFAGAYMFAYFMRRQWL